MPDFFFNLGPGQAPFSDEACTQAFEPTRPYPQEPTAIFYRARFKQLRAYYTKPAPNTPHPNLPQVYFADDVDFQDKMGGLIEWTRIYCTLPNSWNDFASDVYTFPGLAGLRVPVSKTVTQKILNDYFLVGSLPTFDNLLTSYDNFAGAAWNANGITVSANATGTPACAGISTNTAAKLTDSGSGFHFIMQGGGATAAKPVAAFLKNGNANVARVAMVNPASPNLDLAFATFDLRTGLQIANANATGVIAAIGDGWWRAGIQNVVGSQTNAALAVCLCDDNGTPNYVASGRNLYAWRGMIPNISTTIPHATVPPTLTVDSSNYPILNADAIPVKFGTQYVFNWAGNAAAEYLSGGTAPNLTTYQGWIANDQANGNSNSYSIESSDSTLSLWQGSVWNRQRHFVKAR
ncbi:MAG TPA: hypothetical protein VHN11_21150 [Xanthobacteraceae bacterium]|jgi:hypothetical protein|nr:hypothetical protein [Xanthobacteraceae bacterium]